MTCKINLDTSSGLQLESDTSGALDIQSNGVTKMSMDTSGNLTANSFIGITKPLILHVRDEKTATTSGGSSSAATDNVRTLNTVVTNEITGASLASNQITLPAGTYSIQATAPAFLTNRHRIFLYNTSDSAVEVLGRNVYSDSTDSGFNTSDMTGRFTIASSKVFELRHYTESARASNGLGVDANDSRTSIFADVIITKVA